MSMRHPKSTSAIKARAFLEAYDRAVERHGIDPINTLFELMKPNNDPQVRAKAATALLPYRFPKLQSLALDTPDENIQLVVRIDPNREYEPEVISGKQADNPQALAENPEDEDPLAASVEIG